MHKKHREQVHYLHAIGSDRRYIIAIAVWFLSINMHNWYYCIQHRKCYNSQKRILKWEDNIKSNRFSNLKINWTKCIWKHIYSSACSGISYHIAIRCIHLYLCVLYSWVDTESQWLSILGYTSAIHSISTPIS